MTQPLSPRSNLCQQIEEMLPCCISFSQGPNAFRTEIDEHSDIKQLFNEAVEYLRNDYQNQSPLPGCFIMHITAQNASKTKTMNYYPDMIEIPDAIYCESRPGSPSN